MNPDYALLLASKINKKFNPKIKESVNYKTWVSIEDERRCIVCENNHGKVSYIKEIPLIRPPVHFICRCRLELLKAIIAGTATVKGIDGADWWLKFLNKLPENYISRSDARKNGWNPKKGNLNESCPEKLIFGGKYYNTNKHLPSAKGREWYEADINYDAGFRNTQRIVYSNDGLIFVTYDHYKTFYEII